MKQSLIDMKVPLVPLVPLLLVQADSTEKSIEKLNERWLRMGFTEEQIAVHTRPDESARAPVLNVPLRDESEFPF